MSWWQNYELRTTMKKRKRGGVPPDLSYVNITQDYDKLANLCLYRRRIQKGNVYAYNPEDDCDYILARNQRIIRNRNRFEWVPYPEVIRERTLDEPKECTVRVENIGDNDWRMI